MGGAEAARTARMPTMSVAAGSASGRQRHSTAPAIARCTVRLPAWRPETSARSCSRQSGRRPAQASHSGAVAGRPSSSPRRSRAGGLAATTLPSAASAARPSKLAAKAQLSIASGPVMAADRRARAGTGRVASTAALSHPAAKNLVKGRRYGSGGERRLQQPQERAGRSACGQWPASGTVSTMAAGKYWRSALSPAGVDIARGGAAQAAHPAGVGRARQCCRKAGELRHRAQQDLKIGLPRSRPAASSRFCIRKPRRPASGTAARRAESTSARRLAVSSGTASIAAIRSS